MTEISSSGATADSTASIDTGDLLAVPPEQQLDVDDQDPFDTALAGGADDQLDDVYANPDGHA